MTATLPAGTAEKPTLPRSRGRWVEHWEPEDDDFWASVGRKTARRNLIFSIFAEHLGFSVWVIWSVLVVALGTANPQGFPFLDPKIQANAVPIFWLVALPNLIGAIIRLPYTVAVARFGGRNWTIVSALLLLIPVSLALYCVTHPGTPYWFFLLVAATAGFGGGNFASSMANISYFYPERRKGTALGLNAAGGNLGLSSMQLVVPMVVFLGLGVALATSVWLPVIFAAAICAFFFMDNLHVGKSTFREQFAAVRRPHAWVMSFLYIGTFGSFLGLSAAFPAVLKFVFPEHQKFNFLATGLILPLAFLGPLVGSIARPLGGWLSDHVGGARVTAAVFALMSVCTFGAIWAADSKNLALFITSMLVLFTMAGAGNGSTYRMIPAIFKKKADEAIEKDPGAIESIIRRARREGAATLGMAGAIGASGGFILPKTIGDSIKATGGIGVAFSWFLGMYVVCLVVTYAFYMRPGTKLKGV
jgi:NNP family nitrate/nitrite transporter-like MFS transporter